jgi:hypothetical protein
MRVISGVMVLSACVLVAVTVRVSAQGQGAGQGQGTGTGQTPPAGPGRQGGGGGGGQAPSNLQVLPKDWNGQQVQRFMQNFTRGLGMMCNDCHVQGNRASDDLKPKQTARQMLKMMLAINADYLKDVGEPAAEGTYKVTCYTCHRGQRKPLNAPPPPGGGGF